MELKTILEKMETSRPNAEMEVQTNPASTYGGRLGLKRAATETLKQLRIEYHRQLLSSTVFIIVAGSNKDRFSELASSDAFGCFSVDPEEFYKDIASRINPSLFGRESTRALFNIAGNVLEDKALELDIQSYPSLAFSEKYNRGVSGPDDFASLIRSAVNDQVGSEIVGINAVYSIVDKAIGKKHAATVTPVVLNTSDENFALDLQTNLKRLTKKVFLVVAGKSKTLKAIKDVIFVKDVSEESVGEALTTIRGKL